jgi:hypothetical protein
LNSLSSSSIRHGLPSHPVSLCRDSSSKFCRPCLDALRRSLLSSPWRTMYLGCPCWLSSPSRFYVRWALPWFLCFSILVVVIIYLLQSNLPHVQTCSVPVWSCTKHYLSRVDARIGEAIDRPESSLSDDQTAVSNRRGLTSRCFSFPSNIC